MNDTGDVLLPGEVARSKRGQLVGQVWRYTAFVAVGIGGLVWVLTGDAWLGVQIVVLSALVGGVGTVMAICQTPVKDETPSADDSIFR
jgi:hypothetical protein